MTDPRPRILVLTHTPIDREPRALKQINYFAQRADVTTAGFGSAPVEGVPHIELESSPATSGLLRIPGLYTLLLGLRQYRLFDKVKPRNRAALPLLQNGEWDVVIAHDVHTLALAQQLTATKGILLDLHEYAPRQNENSFLWRLLIAPYFRWICRTQVPNAAGVTTVGQGIVDEYRRQFGFESTLVVNATPYQELTPGQVGSTIRMVHSGIPAPARKLEAMIEAVKLTRTDVTLDLYLIKDGSAYYDELVALAGDDPRIFFRDPVPYAELVQTLNQYDVGLSVIAPTTFNLAWCLPNKFFDFIQARLGVIVGPSPEMVAFVERYGIGEVAEGFDGAALAKVLDGLTPETVRNWKEQSHENAHALSSEEQVKIWGEVVDGILARA
ncbi:glycosyltransferase family 1 protein [Microbacterium soli]|uniref:Glycosyltransferase family 4 protein n=1 Tax=Microbacterium soli TaxID=446075 RepID=A0ABP7MP38_9MICO